MLINYAFINFDALGYHSTAFCLSTVPWISLHGSLAWPEAQSGEAALHKTKCFRQHAAALLNFELNFALQYESFQEDMVWVIKHRSICHNARSNTVGLLNSIWDNVCSVRVETNIYYVGAREIHRVLPDFVENMSNVYCSMVVVYCCNEA